MGRRWRNGRDGGEAGFTLLELLVVLFILALLGALAVPSVQGGLVRAREAALAQDLAVLRGAIGDFRADRGAWPADLEALVEARYIDRLPDDPMGAGWRTIPAPAAAGQGGIAGVATTATGTARDGRRYDEW